MSEGDTDLPWQPGLGRPSAPDVHTAERNGLSAEECVCLAGEGKARGGLSALHSRPL